MLLCVGDFFSCDPASEEQLEAYKIAEKKGLSIQLNNALLFS